MRAVLIASIVACALGAAASARADDPAAAQALFTEAKTLMAQGKWADACPKLEESQRLAPAVGTKFNLADCYEHTGKVASAWAMFLSVAASTKSANQAAREKAARERAAALEPKLPRLAVVVPPASRVDGLDVKRDGEAVGAGQWGEAMPVNPGEHTVSAAAPGMHAWKTVLDVAGNASTTKVIVPELEEVKAETPPAPAASPGAGGEERARVPPPKSEPAPAPRDKTLGWVLVGAGGAAVVGGVVFWVMRGSAASTLDAECGPDGKSCPPSATNDIANGKTYTALGVGAFALGAVCIGAGAGVLLLGGGGVKHDATPSARLVPLGPREVGVVGRF